MSDEKISQMLDIPGEYDNEIINVTVAEKDKSSPIVVSDSEIRKDIKEIRANLKALIQTANDAIEGMLEVATESGEARAYEVAGQLIHVALETNEKLLNLHTDGYKQVAKAQQALQQKAENITNNTIYAGNTTELLAALKKHRNDVQKEEPAPDVIEVEQTQLPGPVVTNG